MLRGISSALDDARAAYSTFGYAEVDQIPLAGLDNRHLAAAKPVYLRYGRKEKETTR